MFCTVAVVLAVVVADLVVVVVTDVDYVSGVAVNASAVFYLRVALAISFDTGPAECAKRFKKKVWLNHGERYMWSPALDFPTFRALHSSFKSRSNVSLASMSRLGAAAVSQMFTSASGSRLHILDQS